MASSSDLALFFFNDTATTEIYTLSLHDALPILRVGGGWNDADIGGSGLERARTRSEEHTSELQSRLQLVCRLLLEKQKTLTHAQSTPQKITKSTIRYR